MRETLEFIDPRGGVLDFTAKGCPVDGVTGRGMPPIQLVEHETPGIPGAAIDDVQIKARSVDLPWVLFGVDELDVRRQMRLKVRDLNPRRGDGTLRSVLEDGSVRELTCRYDGGLTWVEQFARQIGPTFWRSVVGFRAGDPYWYDGTDIEVEWTVGEDVASFFPIFPVRLSSSEVFAQATIDNDGDVEAWPVWTITGPGEDLVLENVTSDRRLALDGLLAPGEVLTIDTRPFRKIVRNDAGVNLFGRLSGPDFWPLEESENQIEVQLNSATDASRVQMHYRRRYLAG